MSPGGYPALLIRPIILSLARLFSLAFEALQAQFLFIHTRAELTLPIGLVGGLVSSRVGFMTEIQALFTKFIPAHSLK